MTTLDDIMQDIADVGSHLTRAQLAFNKVLRKQAALEMGPSREVGSNSVVRKGHGQIPPKGREGLSSKRPQTGAEIGYGSGIAPSPAKSDCKCGDRHCVRRGK